MKYQRIGQGKFYCGKSLDWNYKHSTVDMPMSGYVETLLQKYQQKQTYENKYAHICRTLELNVLSYKNMLNSTQRVDNVIPV